MADTPSRPKAVAKSKKSDDAELLARARERFELARAASDENRRNYVEDVRFSCSDDQWDPAVKKARGDRPALTFNALNGVIKQIIGDYRQHKLAIKVLPASGEASEDTAEILAGVIRNIEQQSDADMAYATALDCAARGGFGFFRVLTEYCGDDVFDQDLVIRPIHNPLTVYFDPAARLVTRADAEWCFVTEMMSKERLEQQYGQVEAVDFEGREFWFQGEDVRIAEYFEKERYSARLAAFSNGMVVEIEDDAEIDALARIGVTLTAEREAERVRVVWRRMTGAKVLETQTIPTRYIPVVPVLGEEVNVEGKVVTRSAIYYAKDAQRNLNYWKTCATEAVALAPKTKWLVTPEQIQGFEGQWANANASPIAYLPYNEGHGAPQQVPPATPPIAEMNLAMSAGDDIKRTTGIYDASLGARSNETSGRAIVARQQEGDTATYIFLDNLKKAIEHCGRILLDWIPAVYDTERVVRVLDMEGNPRSEVVNQRQYDPATGVVEVLNSLRLGKYDVVMDAGPSFASRKAEGLAAMTQLAQAYPPLMQLAGDLVVGSMDFPGAEQVAARLKRSIPPQITTDPESEEGQQMQAQQQAQQAQQQQMAQQAMQAKLSVEQGKIEAENAKSQATIAKANADVLKARADTVQTIAEAHSARSEDPQPAPNEPAPPAPQSSSSPGVTIQFNAEHALNGIGQTMTGMANENATAARQQMAVIGQILTATAESTKALVASIEGQRQENAQQTVFLTAALETQRQAAAEQVQAVITALKDQQRLTSDQAAAMQRIGSEAARGNVQVAEAVEELARVMAAPRVPVRDKQGNIVASEIKV